MDPVEPSITVLEIDHTGEYTERAHLSGDATVTLTSPFPVELSAWALHPH